MRRFLTLLFVLMLVFSLSAIAKDFCDFEYDSPADSIKPWACANFYRDSIGSHIVVTDKHWSDMGNHSVKLTIDQPGYRWLLICKAKWNASMYAYDETFLPEIVAGDTIYYYLFIPTGVPIDSIFIFERDSLWTQDPKAIFHAADLNFGCWNAFKSGVADTGANGTTMLFPLVQIDFEVRTPVRIAGDPAWTLYFDCPSSLGPVPADTAGQSGIIEGSDGITVEASINSVKLSLSKAAPITVSIYNVIGQQVYESAGFVPAGETDVEIGDLANGVYTVRVVSGKGSAKLTKLLVVR